VDARGINGLINMECSKWRDNKNAWVRSSQRCANG
jgi:hypothetical protein